ncbi:MAG: hypothetical protein ACRDL2_00115, partial [Gaiellaceae bacterium]
MAIIVGKETRLVVQGLTGSEGRFHGLRNRAYGTNVVAGAADAREPRLDLERPGEMPLLGDPKAGKLEEALPLRHAVVAHV